MGLSARLFERHGPAASPGKLLGLTPLELIALFTSESGAGDGDGELDPVAELHRHSHEILGKRGLKPQAPDWLMKGVPRGR